jgi:uncharacterized protein (TIGR00369 family)
MADPTDKEAREPNQRVFSGLIPHMDVLGMETVEARNGVAVIRLPWRPELVGNPETGVLHGGVVTTLIDTVSGLAAITGLAQPEPVATLDLRIDHLKPATPKADLFARAECYRLTSRIAFVRATAYQNDPEDLVASSVSTFMLTKRLGPIATVTPADKAP